MSESCGNTPGSGNLRRWIVRVPFLSLSLSSRWLTLITPVYAAIGRCLIESVRNPSVVRNPAALEAFRHSAHGDHARDRARPRPTRIRTRRKPAGRDARARARVDSAQPERARDLLINEQTIRVPVTPASGVRSDSPYWRPDRLVLRQCAVEDSRPDRSDDGRRRHAARPARSRRLPFREALWISGVWSLRARPAASTVRRDEGPGARLAGVPRGTRWHFDGDPADRAVRTARTDRDSVLVSSQSDSRTDVPGNVAAHCRRSSPPGNAGWARRRVSGTQCPRSQRARCAGS